MTVCFFGAHVKLEVSQLLDEVHSLIQRKGIRFILSGSSPRKLKRYGANLLGGRASKIQLFPFVSAEIPDFNIIRAVNNGMIPRHYMAKNPWERFQAYISVYLNEEIREEALSRNLQIFSHFMEIAAQCDGEIVVYKNIAQDCGIDQRTVKSYFEVMSRHLKGLKAFSEEFPDCRLIVVSFDTYRRKTSGVEIIPVLEFLSDLWNDKIL